MRDSSSLSETELARLEQRKDPESVPHLVSIVRQQQHDLDGLRLSLDVARRDREELRLALLAAQHEIRRLKQPGAAEPGVAGAGPGAEPGGQEQQ